MMLSSTGVTATGPPVVEVEGLTKSYGDVRALQGIDFTVASGSVVGFLGPNGAGKSTAIRILTGYLGADAGRAKVCGFDVETDPIAVKSRLGYLPENNPLYLDMRVEDMLRFAARARGLRGAAIREAVTRGIEQTGLEPVWRRAVGACSKGYRQRVGLAQALLHDPTLLILDEPTNGLDPLQVVEIRNLIRELGQTKTVLLTSHVLPEVEALADRVVLLHRGRIVADGPLESLTGGVDGGAEVRVAILGDEAALRSLLDGVGAEYLQAVAPPFAAAGASACRARVDGVEQTQALAAAAASAGVPLLELAPQGATLEALFRSLASDGEHAHTASAEATA